MYVTGVTCNVEVLPNSLGIFYITVFALRPAALLYGLVSNDSHFQLSRQAAALRVKAL